MCERSGSSAGPTRHLDSPNSTCAAPTRLAPPQLLGIAVSSRESERPPNAIPRPPPVAAEPEGREPEWRGRSSGRDTRLAPMQPPPTQKRLHPPANVASVRACVRMCVRACVRVRVCVCVSPVGGGRTRPTRPCRHGSSTLDGMVPPMTHTHPPMERTPPTRPCPGLHDKVECVAREQAEERRSIQGPPGQCAVRAG